jgi:hypothetical protein
MIRRSPLFKSATYKASAIRSYAICIALDSSDTVGSPSFHPLFCIAPAIVTVGLRTITLPLSVIEKGSVLMFLYGMAFIVRLDKKIISDVKFFLTTTTAAGDTVKACAPITVAIFHTPDINALIVSSTLTFLLVFDTGKRYTPPSDAIAKTMVPSAFVAILTIVAPTLYSSKLISSDSRWYNLSALL